MRFLNLHAVVLTIVPVLASWALAGISIFYMWKDKTQFQDNTYSMTYNGYLALKATSYILYAMVGTVAYLQGAPASTRWWLEARNRAVIEKYTRPTAEEVAKNDTIHDMPAL